MKHYILDFIQPGSSVDHIGDKIKNNELNNILIHIIHSFYEANIAYIKYIQTTNIEYILHQWEERKKYVRPALTEFANIYNISGNGHASDENIFVKNYIWQHCLPATYETISPYMYAKIYLFALDNLKNLLSRINDKDYQPTPEVNLFIKKIDDLFPYLRSVRNSAHHIEDRIVGLGTNKTKFELKTESRPKVQSTSIATGELFNHNYGYTSQDGTYQEVEISFENLACIRDELQKLLNSYKWIGAKQHLPD